MKFHLKKFLLFSSNLSSKCQARRFSWKRRHSVDSVTATCDRPHTRGGGTRILFFSYWKKKAVWYPEFPSNSGSEGMVSLNICLTSPTSKQAKKCVHINCFSDPRLLIVDVCTHSTNPPSTKFQRLTCTAGLPCSHTYWKNLFTSIPYRTMYWHTSLRIDHIDFALQTCRQSTYQLRILSIGPYTFS